MDRKEGEFDAIVPIWDDGHIESLHSIYKKNVENIIRDLIKNKKRSVKSLIECLNVEYVDIEELDETTISFQNLNTIKDFEVINLYYSFIIYKIYF